MNSQEKSDTSGQKKIQNIWYSMCAHNKIKSNLFIYHISQIDSRVLTIKTVLVLVKNVMLTSGVLKLNYSYYCYVG